MILRIGNIHRIIILNLIEEKIDRIHKNIRTNKILRYEYNLLKKLQRKFKDTKRICSKCHQEIRG